MASGVWHLASPLEALDAVVGDLRHRQLAALDDVRQTAAQARNGGADLDVLRHQSAHVLRARVVCAEAIGGEVSRQPQQVAVKEGACAGGGRL